MNIHFINVLLLYHIITQEKGYTWYSIRLKS